MMKKKTIENKLRTKQRKLEEGVFVILNEVIFQNILKCYVVFN